jgi:hypothetical protein
MLLNEILDSKMDYEVKAERDDTFMTSMQIGERTIRFVAAEESPGEWEISFHEIKNGKRTYDLTKNGDELKVFSMVIASTKEFVQRYTPRVIMFTADKEGNVRGQLYDRLSKKFKLPGYTYQKAGTDKHEVFTFVKN